MKFYDVYFDDIYSLFNEDFQKMDDSKSKKIDNSKIKKIYLITGKNSRNQIKYYISKEEIIILLLNSFIYLTDVVIIGDLIMCIKINYPSLPKPQLIKIPKPTSIMVKNFYSYFKNLNMNKILENFENSKLHNMYLGSVKIKLNFLNIKKWSLPCSYFLEG